MIVKVVVIEPSDPTKPLCYQVPENSKELALLTSMLHDAGLDYRIFDGTAQRPRWVRARIVR
jgi:hypothetical protein